MAPGATAVYMVDQQRRPAGRHTLNTATGALGGVPSAAGAFQFTVDVSDSLARKASKSFSLAVAAPLGISSAPGLPRRPRELRITGVGGDRRDAAVYRGASQRADSAWALLRRRHRRDLGRAHAGRELHFTAQVMDNNSVRLQAVHAGRDLQPDDHDSIVAARRDRGLALRKQPERERRRCALRLDLRNGAAPGGPGTRSAQRHRGDAERERKFRIHTAGRRTRVAGSGSSRFYIAVTLPPLPSVSIDGLPDPTNAADQPAFSVSLATSYPVHSQAQLWRHLLADAEIAIDDAAIQFRYGRTNRELYDTRGQHDRGLFNQPDGAADRDGGGYDHAESFPAIRQGRGDGRRPPRTLHVLRTAPVTRAWSCGTHSGRLRAAYYGLLQRRDNSRRPWFNSRPPQGATCKRRS